MYYACLFEFLAEKKPKNKGISLENIFAKHSGSSAFWT